MLNSYEKVKNQIQERINSFPLGFAFSNEQFKEMMSKWRLNPETDLNKITSLGCGGYIRKSDIEAYKVMLAENENELKEALEDDDTLKDAFLYELANHEYAINYYQGNYDTLTSLGFELKDKNKDFSNEISDFALTDREYNIFNEAVKEYEYEREKRELEQKYGEGYCDLDDEEKEIIEAYTEINGNYNNDVDKILHEKYVTICDSFEDFARMEADDYIASLTYGNKEAEALARYFDYEQYERELQWDFNVNEDYNGKCFIFWA